MLFEDDFCLVVHKPAGLAVHPDGSSTEVTLDHLVAAHYAASGGRFPSAISTGWTRILPDLYCMRRTNTPSLCWMKICVRRKYPACMPRLLKA